MKLQIFEIIPAKIPSSQRSLGFTHRHLPIPLRCRYAGREKAKLSRLSPSPCIAWERVRGYAEAKLSFAKARAGAMPAPGCGG
jgi:hypothetical protein